MRAILMRLLVMTNRRMHRVNRNGATLFDEDINVRGANEIQPARVREPRTVR